MTPDPTRIRRYITEFTFKPLFVEELGWDDLRSAPLTVTVAGQHFTLRGVAEKRGLVLLQCDALPPYPVRRQIDREVTKYHREHLIVFAAADKAAQVWLWVRREPGKPAAGRERHYYRGESGERVAQTLAGLAFALEEEGRLTLLAGVGRVRAAFDVERVTRRFYDRFKREHDALLKFITGIPDAELQRWYASVMINRIMFIYFVQRKGFLAGDTAYLATRLAATEQRGGDYYRDFLRVLFFQGFAVREDARTPAVQRLLGSVPYLNGGLFAVHPVEEQYGAAIQIPNAAFRQLYAFFDEYNWHLDERPLRDDNEINPDVLGYIFEKYINQKQMGAYYTKEDITDYICKNVILPYLLDAVRRELPAAFDADVAALLAQIQGGGPADFDAEARRRRDAQSTGSSSAGLRAAASPRQNYTTEPPTIWRLLAEDPDRYIYPAVQHGVDRPLPDNIAAGVADVSQRGEWNRSAPPEFGLPTEIWREVAARRQRYAEVHARLASGQVTTSDDLITLNLNIRQFVRDVIDTCTDPALLRACWQALRSLAVLDPTGGSGAFLFAALNILEDLYDACLERMEWFLAEQHAAPPTDTRLADFRATLAEVERHPNRRYFILKSIIVHNLYAVDIMEEAVEICKLRLFLKLVAQVARTEQIEPLPDIDFNIRAGNTLVGFVTREDVKTALEVEQRGGGAAQGRLVFGEEQSAIDRIEAQAKAIDKAFGDFRQLQTQLDAPPASLAAAKAGLKTKLAALDDELNRLLARQYGVKVEDAQAYRRWLASHKPFHWFVEFYGVLARGGFDAIVGNPPYVELAALTGYQLRGYTCTAAGNLYAVIVERCISIGVPFGRQGYVVPVSSISTDRYMPLQNLVASRELHYSSFDDRPSRLFDGLEHIRLTIHLLGAQTQKPTLYSTRYNKWSAIERPSLFHVLRYASARRSLVDGSLPKLASEIEHDVIHKLEQVGRPLHRNLLKNSDNAIFYSRKVGYFLQVTDFQPRVLDGLGQLRPPSEFKPLYFASKQEAQIGLSALNSSLFFWFITVWSDCRHLNRREVEAFPLDVRQLSLEDTGEQLARLSQALMVDLQRNSLERTMRFAHDTLTLQWIIPKFSKPIIDEIDRVLARHYGFTAEELDYILNYDIKYRLEAEEVEDGEG
jgi:hypothetical protein